MEVDGIPLKQLENMLTFMAVDRSVCGREWKVYTVIVVKCDFGKLNRSRWKPVNVS